MKLPLRHLVLGAAVTIGFALSASAPATATPPPPTPAPIEDPGSQPLIPVPLGCVAPTRADVAFVGTALAKDFEKVRFRIDQLRAGSASRFSVDGVVDVLYLEDTKFLMVDDQYLIGARFDPAFGQLVSTVRPPEPLFGGNDVIGLEDTDVDCPTLDDPVRTVQPDGTSVDSGVLSPLFENKRTLAATIGVPTGIAFAVIIALVLLRSLLRVAAQGIFSLGRAAVTPTVDHKAIRVRRHNRDDPLAE